MQIHLAIEEEQEREREKIEQAKQIRSISDMMDNFALVKVPLAMPPSNISAFADTALCCSLTCTVGSEARVL